MAERRMSEARRSEEKVWLQYLLQEVKYDLEWFSLKADEIALGGVGLHIKAALKDVEAAIAAVRPKERSDG